VSPLFADPHSSSDSGDPDPDAVAQLASIEATSGRTSLGSGTIDGTACLF